MISPFSYTQSYLLFKPDDYDKLPTTFHNLGQTRLKSCSLVLQPKTVNDEGVFRNLSQIQDINPKLVTSFHSLIKYPNSWPVMTET